ncbi:HK97 family phage prohead protease [Amycolatopsis sp. lyj-112]|uniref:HK97 family phage prohead protease n=1 Tax=Amycolatopsis sp. lyj-112 TaxID=2789288 RepID=UPI0039782EBB
MKQEIRSFESEFDTRSEHNKLVITGYAAVFNSRTQLQPRLFEEIRSGAFTKTIQEADVRALYNHDPMYVLGRNKAGTLRLSQDDKGLHYEVDMPDTQTGRDVYESIQRGDISQSSFAFYPVAGKTPTEWERSEEGRYLVRTLQEVKLKDVSPVTYPAYQDATVGVRAAENIAEMRGLELGDKDLAEALELIEEEQQKPSTDTYVARKHIDTRILELRNKYLK